MKKLNKKGFTLVELMVSLVIIALIFVLATTVVLRQLNKAKTNSFVNKVKQYVKALDTDALERKLYDEYAEYSFPKDKIPYVDKQPDAGYAIKSETNKFKVAFWDEKLEKCAVKDFSGADVEIDPSLDTKAKCLDRYASISGKNVLGKKAEDLSGYETKDSKGNDAYIKASCYTLDSSNYIDNYNVDSCGPSLYVPDEINGKKVKGFSYSFSSNLSGKGLKEVYIVDVDDFDFLPSGFLANGSYDFSTFKKIVLMKLNNLTDINGGFLYGIYDLSDVIIRDLPNLTNISSGNFYYSGSKFGEIKNIELVNLPKVSQLSAVFAFVKYNNLTIKNVGAEGSKVSSSSFQSAYGQDATVIIEDNPYLDFYYQSLSSPLGAGGSTYKKISIKNNGGITVLGYSMFMSPGFDNASIIIENNAALTSITNGLLNGSSTGDIKEVIVRNNPNLTVIDSGFMSGSMFNYSNGKIIIENNPKLEQIGSSSFCIAGNLDSVLITKNNALTTFTNGSFNVCGPTAVINNFIIKDNASLSIIENGSFGSLTINNFIFENLPSLTSLARYGAMYNLTVDKFDLSKTTIDTIDTTNSLYSSHINTMILPTTLTSFNPSFISSAITGKIYAAGSNKCLYNDNFKTYDSEGHETGYVCNPDILPVCN